MMFQPRLVCVALVTLVAAVFSPWADAADDAAVRVMSYNVRNSRAADGENAWPKRLELFFEPIRDFGPDLIGFQEVLADQHDEIARRLTAYSFSGVARDDGVRKGEWSLIGYRKERFSLVKAGDFWLSETPDVIGSKSWDAALTRLCSWVRLRDRITGRELVYANTHFDHKGVIARREASRVLSERLAPIAAGVPAILSGDLNINEDNPAYLVLVQPTNPALTRWIDTYRAVHPVRKPDEASFNGFKDVVVGSRIDFIFCTSHFTPTAAAIVRTSRNGRFPSDHYPVTAVLQPKKPGTP
ncbi:endonuclease/exonuclease/phosphatase family protein [Horticoccus sp. 23ND18S-11]|uniref:endonuclease/exonuclease/phosphatase family protein n=1 Tax=Horticoccus sp. 23ND18S-11 TaxID=3391832 RepID=UPI0039C94D09